MTTPFVFAPSRKSAQPAGEDDGMAMPPFPVLVVDDDEEVHTVTRLILSKLRFRGRSLEIVTATSEAQARAILKERQDFALALLDVVMETEDAGLRLVRHIREDLHNRAMRVVLRTGQPGQAPEQSVIVDFDINDYKAKTELTAQKLFTMTISALRAFEDIVALEQSRRGLEQILDSMDTLFKSRSIQVFSAGVLTQLAALTGAGPNGILCVQRAGSRDMAEMLVMAAVGGLTHLAEHQATAAALPQEIRTQIERTLATRHDQRDSRYLTLFVASAAGREIVVVLDAPRLLTENAQALLTRFAGKISIGFDNIFVFEQLANQLNALEEQVSAKTRALELLERAMEKHAAIREQAGRLSAEDFDRLALAELMRARRYRHCLSILHLTVPGAALDTVTEAVARRLRRSDSIGQREAGGISILLPETAEGASAVAATGLRVAIKSALGEQALVGIGTATADFASMTDAERQQSDGALLVVMHALAAARVERATEMGGDRTVWG